MHGVAGHEGSGDPRRRRTRQCPERLEDSSACHRRGRCRRRGRSRWRWPGWLRHPGRPAPAGAQAVGDDRAAVAIPGRAATRDRSAARADGPARLAASRPGRPSRRRQRGRRRTLAKPERARAARPNQPIGMTLSPEGSSTEDSEPAAGGTVAAVPPPPPGAAPAPAERTGRGRSGRDRRAGRPRARARRRRRPWTRTGSARWRRTAPSRARRARRSVPQYLKCARGAREGRLLEGDPRAQVGVVRARRARRSATTRSTGRRGAWRHAATIARPSRDCNEVVSRYPKSDKAPAALWEQGQLQLRSGNYVRRARHASRRLVRDYPASAEAGRARRKLVEIAN